MRGLQSGFTLVELVITIALMTIVISFMAMFIAGPVRAYNDQTRRAELVDVAESSLRRVARDIRSALPNSVRVANAGGLFALEMLNTVDGVRYRDRPPPGNPAKRLRFAGPDDAFNSVGQFNAIPRPFSSTTHYLSIYNVGVPGADAYELANVITPPGTRIDIDADATPDEDNVRLTPAYQFAFASPGQRVYLVDEPVSWICDTVTGTLVRYTDYAITADHADRDSGGELLGAGASAALVADNVSACAVTYAPGTSQRSGLVTLTISVADAGESVSLLHQVHVNNVP